MIRKQQYVRKSISNMTEGYDYYDTEILLRVDEVMTEIIQRCRLYGAQKIILYGSRAKGTATERSDIDIAVSGVASHEILDLQENLEEIPTLYTIDLVDLDTCQNQLLLEDIKQYGREIYKKI